MSAAAASLRRLVTPKPSRFSQGEVAASLGVSQQAVSNWLAGLALPSPEHMAELERRYGIPMRDWVEPSKKTGTAA